MQLERRWHLPAVFWLAAILGPAGALSAPNEATRGYQNSIGLALRWVAGEPYTASSVPAGLARPTASAPFYLLVRARRMELEHPDRLDPLLDAAASAGMRVVVRLTDRGLDPAQPVPDKWVERVAAFAVSAGDRVAAYQILDAPADRYPPENYAYLLKKVAVAARGAHPGVRILSGSIRAKDAGWFGELLSGDVSLYLDVLAADTPAALATVNKIRDEHHPRAATWVVDTPFDPYAPRAGISQSVFESFAAGAETILFEAAPGVVPASGVVPGGLRSLLLDLRSMLPDDMGLASTGALPFDPDEVEGALELIPFYDARSRTGVVAVRTGDGSGTRTVRLRLRAPVLTLDLYDPRKAQGQPLGHRLAMGKTIEIPLRDDFQLLRYRISAKAVPVQEAVEVSRIRQLNADEIIAREREVSAAQESRLDHYEAIVSVAIHYRIASLSAAVDVVTDNRLYVHDGNQDYEQIDMYVDGARWRGKNPPHLPFLQPDKVKELPLDISLDEGYRYRLVGRERIRGRDCYVIGFVPTVSDRSLYEGKIAIDSELFTRVRMEAVQNGLEPPLRSNRVVYEFEPLEAADDTFWLPTKISGQMVFEVLGENLLVEREATYTEYAVNGEEFAERVSDAYASGRPIFRETDEGYFALAGDGEAIRLEDASVPRNAFLVFGTSIGNDGDLGFPFAGVNFFDFDFRGTGTQLDIAWAGPFIDIIWTNPQLWRGGEGGRPWALTVEGALTGVQRNDRLARSSGEVDEEQLEFLSQWVRAALAVPMGHFAKWSLEARGTWTDYSQRDNTAESFRPPSATLEGTLRLRLEYNRRGYNTAAWSEVGQRDDWRQWGFADTPYDPDERHFTRAGLEFVKSFHFPQHRKFSLGGSAFEGHGLDRFSRFEIGDFQNGRVRGFNGAGINFDRGLLADVTYSHSFGSKLRAEIDLEAGWLHGREDFGPGHERIVGAGLRFEFSGPWSTLGTIRISRGLSSTIPGTSGDGSVRVVFFRTFDRWSRNKTP